MPFNGQRTGEAKAWFCLNPDEAITAINMTNLGPMPVQIMVNTSATVPPTTRQDVPFYAVGAQILDAVALSALYPAVTGPYRVWAVSEEPVTLAVAYAATSSPPVNSGGANLPVISGTLAAGQTLTLSNGTWSGSPTFTRRWLRNGVRIAAETGNTYVAQPWDRGASIEGLVIGSNASGSAVARSAAVVIPNLADLVPPRNDALPTITGTAEVGAVLTRTTGSWTGASSYITQWLRGTTAMSGQGGSTYTVQPGDENFTFRVSVTAVAADGSGTTVVSEPTLRVPVVGGGTPPAPVNTALPTITGTAQVGQILTGTEGIWTGSPSIVLQWLRAGVAIAGATGLTYVPVTGDIGAVLTLRATGTNAGGATVAVSAGTAAVIAAVVAPVDLLAAAGSLRFPEGNNMPPAGQLTALNAFKGALSQPITTMFVPASTTPHFTFAIVRAPRDKRYVNATMGILGTDGTGGRTLRLRIAGSMLGTVGQRDRFNLFQRGSTGGTVDILSDIWDEDEALVVAGVDATGAFFVDWYSLRDGVRHPGAPSTIATAAITFGTTQMSIGHAHGTTTGFTANGVTPMWPGAIGAVGVVRRDVTAAEWESIALGADIVTTLGAANLTYLREFDGTPATFARPAAATADPTPAAVPYTGTVGVPPATVGPGSTLRRQSVSQWLSMDRLSGGHVYGLLPGGTSRAVPFSGTAGGLTGNVEVRVFRADTGAIVQDWTSVGAISGGAWSGTLTLPKSSSWLFAQARSASVPSVIFDRRVEFGVGWKFILIGQSQLTIANGGSAGLLDHAHPMTATWVGNDPSPTPSQVQMVRIGMGFAEFSGSEATTRPGLAAFINQFRMFDPTTPIMLIDEAVNGSSMTQIINSASGEGISGTRNMAQLTRKLAAVGNDVTAVVHQWGTDDMWMSDSAFQNLLTALFYGTGPAAVDRSLAAELAPGWVPVMSPLTRHTNRSDDSDARASAVAWANARNLTVGPPVIDLHIENAGGPHQNATVQMGALPVMARMAIAAARAVGADASQNPYFTTAALTGAGATITIQTARPNGGTLFSPAPTALRSFQVNDGGAGTFIGTGFTAAIVGNTVVLTKTSGTWLAGTTVRYRSSGEDRADGDGTAEAAIIAGMLYETWAGDVVMGRGLPVSGSLSGGKWVPDWSVVAA